MAEATRLDAIIPDVYGRLEELAARPRTWSEEDDKYPKTDEEWEAYQQAYVESHWKSVCPKRFQTVKAEDVHGDLAGWDGSQNVLLLGPVGVGKTHQAVALVRSQYAVGRSVMFRSASMLLDELRPNGDPKAMDRACGAWVLVLDDLGAERPTEWTAERMNVVIDERWKQCRPTVVTSNLNPQTLEKAVGPRAWSRLYHGALRLTLTGEDRRRQ